MGDNQAHVTPMKLLLAVIATLLVAASAEVAFVSTYIDAECSQPVAYAAVFIGCSLAEQGYLSVSEMTNSIGDYLEVQSCTTATCEASSCTPFMTVVDTEDCTMDAQGNYQIIDKHSDFEVDDFDVEAPVFYTLQYNSDSACNEADFAFASVNPPCRYSDDSSSPQATSNACTGTPVDTEYWAFNSTCDTSEEVAVQHFCWEGGEVDDSAAGVVASMALVAVAVVAALF